MTLIYSAEFDANLIFTCNVTRAEIPLSPFGMPFTLYGRFLLPWSIRVVSGRSEAYTDDQVSYQTRTDRTKYVCS